MEENAEQKLEKMLDQISELEKLIEECKNNSTVWNENDVSYFENKLNELLSEKIQ
jgi:hypothetical protein